MFTQAALLFLPVSMFHLFLVLFTFSFCKFRLLFPFARSLSDPASLTVWLFWPKTNAMSILARGNTTSTTKDWLTHTRGWQSTKEKMSSFRHLILVWRVSLKLIISRKMKRQFFKTSFQPLSPTPWFYDWRVRWQGKAQTAPMPQNLNHSICHRLLMKWGVILG